MIHLLHLLAAPTPEINCKNFPPACFANITDVGNIVVPLIYVAATFVLLVYLGYGAFLYIFSQGDPSKIEKARYTLTYAVLGIFIIVVAYFLTKVAAWLFSIEFLL